MIVSGIDVIARSSDFGTAATRYELRPWQWRFLHALDGRAELRDVAMVCGIALADALQFVDESEAAGLVRVVSMSHDEYCRWSGASAPADDAPVAQAQTAVAEPEYADIPARGDHFSTSDGLAAYETPVPSWMLEPPAAESQPEPAPFVSHEEAQPVAEYQHDEPVAEYQRDEPVAEYQHDEPVAEYQHDEPVAEYQHDEPVAEYQHDEPVAQYHYEVSAADYHHEEPVAEAHHEEPVAEAQHEEPVAEYQYAEPLAADQHEEPAARYHYEVAAAGYHQDEPIADHAADPSTAHAEPEMTAAQTVADLVGQHPEADVPVHEAPGPNGVSLSFGEPDPAAYSTNGYHHDASSEPATFVTTVDDQPEHAAAAYDAMPAGISISLSSSAAPAAETQPEPAVYDYPAEAPRGSVSFSLSPDDFAPAHDATPIAHDEPPVAMHDDAPVAVHDDAPVTMHEDMPVAMHEDAPVAIHDEPATNGHVDNTPVAPTVASPAATGSSMTVDIVGNLIARALTFRIK